MTEMGSLLVTDTDGRVVTPEGKTLEYKRDLSSPDGPLKSIIAFANTGGGRLVVGVADDGTVLGVDDPLAAEERLASLIADSIRPQIVPGISIVPLAGRTVLAVDVPLSTARPHYLRRRGLETGTYVRVGSTNRQADAPLIAGLERDARGIAYERMPAHHATIADLNLTALPEINGRPVAEDDLLPLGLAVHAGDRIVPTNAGILTTHPWPDSEMPSAWVQMGRLRGPDGTDIFDSTEYHGPMQHAVDEVMTFLTKHAYKTAVFGQVRRRDVLSIPVEPIRELVINAIVHADYSEPGTPIRVVFYDDRIQIEGPGLLVPGMTIEAMRNSSRLRNPVLARIFRAAGLMENFGTGVDRVYKQLAAAGLPEPVFEEVIDRVRVTVPVQSHAVGPAAGEQEVPRGEQDAVSVSKSNEQVDEVVSKSSDRGTPAAGLLTAALTPQRRSVLLAAVGLSDAYLNYQRHIRPLIDLGLLALTVPDKPNSRHQRYVITEAGRVHLERVRGAERPGAAGG